MLLKYIDRFTTLSFAGIKRDHKSFTLSSDIKFIFSKVKVKVLKYDRNILETSLNLIRKPSNG